MEADKPDPDGQRRVAQAIAQVLKTPTKRTYTMPKSGDTRAVRAVKEANQKALAKRQKAQANHNPQVVNEEASEFVDNPSHSQPNHNLEVVQNTENTRYRGIKEDSLKRFNTVLNNQEVIELVNAGVREADIDDHLDVVLAAYRAEGLTPKSSHLVAAILQLHKDVR